VSGKVLVTGGAGFLGSAIVKRLVAAGRDVRVFDDFSRGAPRRLERTDVETVSGDIRDAAAVERAMSGVSTVLHYAFVNGTEFFYSKPELVLEVGVKGMVNVLDAIKKAGTQELFLASSSEVYQTPPSVPTAEDAPLSVPDPLNPRYSYGGGKIISELIGLHHGHDALKRVVVFRPHNVYGPDMGTEHVIPQFALRMGPLAKAADGPVQFKIQGDGSETRAFVHVDDFTDGVELLLSKGEDKTIYHIGTQEETSIADLARSVGRCFEREVEIEPSEAAKGGTKRRCPDISRMKALGYAPKRSLSETLAGTVRWYDENAEKLGLRKEAA